FLYTQGANPDMIRFFKMMLTSEEGAKISRIELVAMTPEEAAKATEPGEGFPGGPKICLPLKPIKKLFIKVAYSGRSDSLVSGSSESLVAEKDGRLVIPVPVPCE